MLRILRFSSFYGSRQHGQRVTSTKLIKFAQADIYTKGTGLDQSVYNKKRAEEEMSIQYYETFLSDERISEEERQNARAKIRELRTKHEREDASMQGRQTEQVQ